METAKTRTTAALGAALLCALGATGCLPPAAPRPMYERAEGAPKEALEPPKVTITGSLLELNQSIYFEFNSDRLLPVSSPILDEVGRVMRAHPELARVRIEGHTDSLGTPTYNLNLSQRRAQAVVAYLTKRGVAAGRMSAAGYGQTQPVADNATEDGRAQNRRVRFLIEQWGKDARASLAPRGLR